MGDLLSLFPAGSTVHADGGLLVAGCRATDLAALDPTRDPQAQNELDQLKKDQAATQADETADEAEDTAKA